ncbi:hypothetical protein ILUMI_09162 [Ignelater luminosus]|uniref:Uncharacterized protein n=1 Tax=Ignelater luminosus TaxID=2038154 RepID=A0A8K0GGA1_IGNLU|nr:hypothetical protein ILUMI_09162 [Ignelater luminosus]
MDVNEGDGIGNEVQGGDGLHREIARMPNKRRKKLKLLLLAAVAHRKSLLLPKYKIKQKNRRWQIRPLNQHRRTCGRFASILKVMLQEDQEEFFKYTRLYVDEYKELVALIDGKLNKRSCLNTITTEERLAITLE